MNPIVCYFLLQLIGLYAMLLVLDYIKKPGSKYLDVPKTPIKLSTYKKNPVADDKAA